MRLKGFQAQKNFIEKQQYSDNDEKSSNKNNNNNNNDNFNDIH